MIDDELIQPNRKQDEGWAWPPMRESQLQGRFELGDGTPPRKVYEVGDGDTTLRGRRLVVADISIDLTGFNDVMDDLKEAIEKLKRDTSAASSGTASDPDSTS